MHLTSKTSNNAKNDPKNVIVSIVCTLNIFVSWKAYIIQIFQKKDTNALKFEPPTYKHIFSKNNVTPLLFRKLNVVGLLNYSKIFITMLSYANEKKNK